MKLPTQDGTNDPCNDDAAQTSPAITPHGRGHRIKVYLLALVLGLGIGAGVGCGIADWAYRSRQHTISSRRDGKTTGSVTYRYERGKRVQVSSEGTGVMLSGFALDFGRSMEQLAGAGIGGSIGLVLGFGVCFRVRRSRRRRGLLVLGGVRPACR